MRATDQPKSRRLTTAGSSTDVHHHLIDPVSTYTLNVYTIKEFP